MVLLFDGSALHRIGVGLLLRHSKGYCPLVGEYVHAMALADRGVRDAQGGVQYHYTLVDFVAEWQAGEVKAGHDAAEVAWADPADLAPYGLWDETERIIALAQDKRGNR